MNGVANMVSRAAYFDKTPPEEYFKSKDKKVGEINQRLKRWLIRNADITKELLDENTYPKFGARMSATVINVTGDGSTYDPICDVVDYNIGVKKPTGYNPVNGRFTAVEEGVYQFNCAVNVEGLQLAHGLCWLRMVTTTGESYLNIHRINSSGTGGSETYEINLALYMKVGQSAYPRISISGGPKTVNIMAKAAGLVVTYFNGHFVR